MDFMVLAGEETDNLLLVALGIRIILQSQKGI